MILYNLHKYFDLTESDPSMLANYHTHTPRCHHASGTEREYVEKAIREGVRVLGFSDHSPYFFDGDYYSTYRMRPEEFEDYMQSIRNLAEEYAGQITLLAGAEIEYYPKDFRRVTAFLADHDCDYLLLGQHFVGDEDKYAKPTRDPKVFDRYVGQVIDGMETGMITYLCHPDLCGLPADPVYQEKGYLKICEAAKRLGLPLELNMLGMAEGRWYPSETFYKIAAAVGNEVVLGCDAHQVHRMADQGELKAAHTFAAHCGITLSELPIERVLARKANIR